MSSSPLDRSAATSSGCSSIYTLKLCLINGYDFHFLEEKLKNINEDISNDMWISYTFLGVTTQSTTFRAMKDPDFKPVIAEFLLYGSLLEIYQRLTETEDERICIYICTHSTMLSSTTLNIGKQLFMISESDQNHPIDRHQIDEAQVAYSTSGTLFFDESQKDDASMTALIKAELLDERMRITYALLLREIHEEELNVECNADKDHMNHASYDWVEKSLVREAKRIEEKEKALISKEKNFDNYVRAKDIEFNDHVKKKERELKLMIEQEASKIERELLELFQASRQEYHDLETKLRDKLSQVDAKERQLGSVLVNKEAELMRRSAELDLKIKLVIEESGHRVEMEKSKVQIAQARIQSLEKELESALKRGRKASNDIDILNQQMRNSVDAKLQNEISLLKGRMIELESTLAKATYEKDRLMEEKESYRASANKLAKILRQERESFKPIQAVHEAQRKTNDNDQLDELQRIQKELKLISVNKPEY